MKRLDPCYLDCGGYFHFAFSKNQFNILKCNNCNLHVLETDQNYDEFLTQYYREGYFKGKDDKFGYADYILEEPMVRKNARGYLGSINKLKSEGSLLDVGCAAGFFMDEARKMGYSVQGIDTSEYIVSLAKDDIREKIRCVPLHKANFSFDQFDIVIMFDLIEHLSDPRNDLKMLGTAVKKNGLLVIGTGDIGSWYAKILGTHNHFCAPPHHLFFFSRKTITEMLNQAGYDVIKIESKGKWLTYPYIARVAKHFNIPLMDKIFNAPLVLRLLQNIWLYLYFGDNMIVYAYKR